MTHLTHQSVHICEGLVTQASDRLCIQVTFDWSKHDRGAQLTSSWHVDRMDAPPKLPLNSMFRQCSANVSLHWWNPLIVLSYRPEILVEHYLWNSLLVNYSGLMKYFHLLRVFAYEYHSLHVTLMLFSRIMRTPSQLIIPSGVCSLDFLSGEK